MTATVQRSRSATFAACRGACLRHRALFAASNPQRQGLRRVPPAANRARLRGLGTCSACTTRTNRAATRQPRWRGLRRRQAGSRPVHQPAHRPARYYGKPACLPVGKPTCSLAGKTACRQAGTAICPPVAKPGLSTCIEDHCALVRKSTCPLAAKLTGPAYTAPRRTSRSQLCSFPIPLSIVPAPRPWRCHSTASA